MPLISQKKIDDCDVELWRIDEPADELAALCSRKDREYSQKFGTDKRKREWLAWHAALKEICPDAEVEYKKSGAPFLKTGGYISVSHAQGYVALALSGAVPCGIDIESRNRDFSRAVPRITTLQERETISQAGLEGIEANALLWCAKEAFYKWAGEEGVDFKDEIFVRDIDPVVIDGAKSRGTISGTVHGRKVKGSYFFEENMCIVCCCG